MPADYNIPMTDAQITEALQLMVERVSEGWAQETYDGSPVGSGSPYYHKSSKWWATQAADAAARAEAAVPAGTAGAVFFDRAQSLTASQAEQARANIVAGGTNPNLLDNPWFTGGGVVNQRGITTLTGTAVENPIVDRWKIGKDVVASVATTGITVTPPTSPSALTTAFRQKIEGTKRFVGKTITLSFNTSMGIKSVTGTVPSTASGYWDVLSPYFNTSMYVRIYIDFPLDRLYVDLMCPTSFTGSAITVYNAKLELGSVCTIANDAPPKKKEELIVCKDYFRRLQNGYSGLANFLNGYVTSPSTCEFINVLGGESMRATPTIAVNGTFTINGNNVSSWAVINTGTTLNLRAIMSGNVLTTGAAASLIASQYAYIDLSADL